MDRDDGHIFLFYIHSMMNIMWPGGGCRQICSGVQINRTSQCFVWRNLFPCKRVCKLINFFCGKFFAPPTPPTWRNATKRVKFCHFGESQIKGTPQIGVYPEKFNIGFLAQIFLGSFYTCREARKKNWSKKSMLNFSR